MDDRVLLEKILALVATYSSWILRRFWGLSPKFPVSPRLFTPKSAAWDWAAAGEGISRGVVAAMWFNELPASKLLSISMLFCANGVTLGLNSVSVAGTCN